MVLGKVPIHGSLWLLLTQGAPKLGKLFPKVTGGCQEDVLTLGEQVRKAEKLGAAQALSITSKSRQGKAVRNCRQRCARRENSVVAGTRQNWSELGQCSVQASDRAGRLLTNEVSLLRDLVPFAHRGASPVSAIRGKKARFPRLHLSPPRVQPELPNSTNRRRGNEPVPQTECWALSADAEGRLGGSRRKGSPGQYAT